MRSSENGSAAVRPRMVPVATLLGSFAAMLSGLFAPAIDPIAGVLITLGGMALLLHAAAALCGAGLKNSDEIGDGPP